ncbi:hypothetical protein BH09PSE4_BH09PSE4_07670 [soil metagenome]
MNDVTTIRPAPHTPVRKPKRSTMESAYDSAARAVEKARDGTTDAARRAAESLDANPMSVLVGGVALGILAGLFVPRTDKEAELLLPVGRKLKEGAETATQAAVDAGKAELAAVGISRIGANEQVGKLIEGIGKAISSASVAAKESRKKGK